MRVSDRCKLLGYYDALDAQFGLIALHRIRSGYASIRDVYSVTLIRSNEPATPTLQDVLAEGELLSMA